MNGIQEVSGSIPLISTKNLEILEISRFFLFSPANAVRLIFHSKNENQEDRKMAKINLSISEKAAEIFFQGLEFQAMNAIIAIIIYYYSVLIWKIAWSCFESDKKENAP